MNALSGYIELDMSGELVAFKFGTNAYALFCEKRKIEFHQIIDTGVFGKFKGDKMIAGPDLVALRDLFYAAHVAACRSADKPPKRLETIGDLLDETKGAMEKLQEVVLSSKIMGYTFAELAGEGKTENFQK